MIAGARPYTLADADACAALWNGTRRGLPALVPVDDGSLHRALVAPESAHDEVAEGCALVHAVGDTVDAWVALCRRRSAPDAPWTAVVRAICASPDDGPAVDALLRGARQWAGGDRLVVGGSAGLRFQNGGDAALPESTGLAPLVVAAGFRLTSRVLILEGPVEYAVPGGPAEVAAADEDGSCRAMVGCRVVGECWLDLAAECSGHPDAGHHAFVQWIGTEPPWRGRGIARQMWSFACARLRARAVRRISLTTPCDNFAAQAFYYRVGLRVADQGLGFEAPHS